MAFAKKQIGAAGLICAVILILLWLPKGPGRAVTLPDASVLKFDGIGVGARTYFYDSGLIMTLRHWLPSRWLIATKLGLPPQVLRSREGLSVSFQWFGELKGDPMRAQRPVDRLILADGDKTYQSGELAIYSMDRGYSRLEFRFAKVIPVNDKLTFKLVSGDGNQLNERTSEGEICVRNPIPKEVRTSRQ